MSTDARRREQALIVGGKLRCPRCGTVSDILSYFTFDRPLEYSDELNVVFKCRARVAQPGGKFEPCRCIFSPGLHNNELMASAS